MINIKKLANILNADVILLSIRDKKANYIDNCSNDYDKDAVNLLTENVNLLTNHAYHSLNYNSGHILTVRVTVEKIICFSFNYNEYSSLNNELLMLHSLSNLKVTAQLIYTLYTNDSAPNDEVLITRFTDKIHIDKKNYMPFDPAFFFKVETVIIKAIVYSDKTALTKALEDLSHITLIGERFASNNIIRGEKDTLISYVAVLNRAIVQWGYPIKKAFQIHNNLVQEIELSPQFIDFFQVIRKITWHYFEIMKIYKINNFLPLHQRIKQYIKEHIHENITLDGIAKELNASKKALNPAFKKEYGTTITKFIRYSKIDIAKELLITSNLSLLEISTLLSFSTTSYFVKTFKEITGYTPNFFRQNPDL
ncbi:helix-turn-helix domain-containing protein [Leuconostoc litchii]|uniref:Helix-turn-helix domain-containing protein n=2 Tax=Leuconostoc litchii TaxID=1981069 RepID=A0A6P2CL02_9LACO|nr:helix-turn-helix domain-containing protein [Leuconostoc litchii]TYC46556.1 helix-turn-helix domain-containing protein [Leuconostoc litchii]